LLSVTVANAVIVGQHHPVALAHELQPRFVFRVLRKVIVVNFYLGAGRAERLGDGFSPERAVDEKDYIIKRP
jgi:hypothetical protein